VTSAILKAQIAHAKARAAIGDCAAAEQILNEAWTDLTDYAQLLAGRGLSPAPALTMHKLLAKAQAAVRRRCPGDLIAPTYRSRRAPAGLIAPTYAPVRSNPDLIAPSFSGAGDASDTIVWGALALGIFSAVVLATGLGRMRT
jgi:hypothetical protein